MNRARANRRLRKAFDSFNKLYFNGRLTVGEVCYEKVGTQNAGDTLFFPGGDTRIRISEGLMEFEVQSSVVLLHEMAHLANGEAYVPHHGQLHAAELHRLYMSGAYEGLL